MGLVTFVVKDKTVIGDGWCMDHLGTILVTVLVLKKCPSVLGTFIFEVWVTWLPREGFMAISMPTIPTAAQRLAVMAVLEGMSKWTQQPLPNLKKLPTATKILGQTELISFLRLVKKIQCLPILLLNVIIAVVFTKKKQPSNSLVLLLQQIQHQRAVNLLMFWINHP